ncbi:phage terminase large subunit [Tepidimonas sp. HKU79]|uniref:phage terminase large subunit n=1 Tax=Tepidimonas sp. HKU79 TaxID=3414505 RepID=UPI003C7EC20E
MTRILIPPIALHGGQQRILESPARYKVIAAGRRFGKTLLAVEWLALMDGGAIDGASVAFFSPTYKLLADVWADFERTLRPVTRKANRTEQRIELITGGKIDFWTLEDPDAGRGRKYHRLVIDEAAHARYLKEAWERAISPTLTDYQGAAWFISTPNGLNYFYELFQRGRDPAYPDWESFHMPSTANPHLRPEEIETKQRELPELVFRQEYLAEFVTFGGGLIKPEMLVMGECQPHLRPVLGVDLAISERDGADYTAIVAMARDPDSGVIYIKEVERFRAGFHEVLTRIKAAAARHNPSIVAIEQTQFQAAVVQELARTTTLPVRGVRPDRDKVTRFAPLLTRFEQRLVRLDPSGCPAAFRDELLAFPDSANDDMVDAASYAFAALGMGQGGYVAAGGRVFR